MTNSNTSAHADYRIAWKFLALAFLVEGVIVVAGGAVGVSLATRYAAAPEETPTQLLHFAALGGSMFQQPLSNSTFWLAIVATAMICIAELARVPLAVVSRTHRSLGIRILMMLGVLMMILVSGKTIAQALEQQFHARLVEVQRRTDDLKIAEADLATLMSKRGSSDVALQPVKERVDAANARIAELSGLIRQQGEAPKERCWKVAHRNRKTGKRWSTTECKTPEWKGQQFADELRNAYAERDTAVAAHNAAASSVAVETGYIAAQERGVAELKSWHRETVNDSQLHSFTAMVFGKDPTEVSDAEVHWFLRLFVFLPALMIACASTLLAIGSVTRLNPGRSVALDSPHLEKFMSDVVDARIAARGEARA